MSKAEQKHPRYKSARPGRSSIAANWIYLPPKAKKLFIKNPFGYLNDIQ